MDKSNVMVEFGFWGQDFSPDEVTQRLGIKPIKTYYIGERIRNTPHVRKETLWEVNTGYEESWDINDQLNKIINLLQDKVEIVKAIQDDLGVEVGFVVVINVVNEEKPAICLEREVVSFLNRINASIQFDYYIYSNE